jgi:hypothetical protein
MEVEQTTFLIAQRCTVLSVSHAGFYAWRTRSASARAGAERLPTATAFS